MSATTITFTADEMMAVAAARLLRDGTVCFVGIGLPSQAANLALRTNAPGLVLIYESGTIGAKPSQLPLSIGDGDLAETATAIVSVPEIFAYWLQAGRIDVGFLGAAQIDRYGNLNSTVIGAYEEPKVRLPGAGGAPEIATSVREVFVMLRQTARTFVQELDFRTTLGHAVSTSRHGPRRARASRRRPRADADRGPPRRRAGRRARGDRLGPARRGRPRAHRPADRRGADRAARAHHPGRPVTDVDPAYLHPEYRSTVTRAPSRVLLTMPEELHALAGPVFGEDTVAAADADLTQGHVGEPLGERIIVTGRVLDDDGRPVPNALLEVWQANAAGRYAHDGDRHPAPLDPNFTGAGRTLTGADGSYRFVTVKPGAYPWRNHENAWRPAHIHFSVFGQALTQRLVTQMYFPGDPLFEHDPIFNSVRDPRARDLLVARFDLPTTEPEWALGYRWDIVLRSTPFEA